MTEGDAVGPGVARGNDVGAVDDGLRQVGDGVHALGGQRGEVDLVGGPVGPGGPVHDRVHAPSGLEPERIGAGAAIGTGPTTATAPGAAIASAVTRADWVDNFVGNAASINLSPRDAICHPEPERGSRFLPAQSIPPPQRPRSLA